MRSLVTGGAGFIGSTLVDALVERGDEVLVVDDLSHGTVTNLTTALDRGARLAEIDVRDASAVSAAFERFRPELIFHLAAQIDVRVSMDRPALDAGVNVLGSINVFDAAHASGARRVVNTSTGGAIYGEADLVPTPETVPPDPLSAYGLSKHTVERYANWFRTSHGLDVVTVRYGNVYGPRQDPAGDAGVIAIFCERALSGATPLVHGDGLQTRDFVFVGDIAAANLAAADAAELPHREYNIGTGIEVSVLELVDAVGRAAGRGPGEFRAELAPARSGEVRRSSLDVSRARRELCLAPSLPLAEGIERTLVWMRTTVS